jgi:uncharacterized membrane-anchored protein
MISPATRTARLALVAAFALIPLLMAPSTARSQSDPVLTWTQGDDAAVSIGELAELDLPPEWVYLGQSDTQRLLELMENPLSGTELATVSPATDEDWFVVFEYDDIGYVKDDEGADLDPDAILESLIQGNNEANKERARRGWGTVEILGWREPPHYDPLTHNLTWAMLATSDGAEIINRNIRLLGRGGVMTVTLVCDPDQLQSASFALDRLLEGYRYVPGSRYEEYLAGVDPVARYGLTALIAGGAAAAAVKSGLFARFWKLIVGGLAAMGAGISKLFGRRSESEPTYEPINPA